MNYWLVCFQKLASHFPPSHLLKKKKKCFYWSWSLRVLFSSQTPQNVIQISSYRTRSKATFNHCLTQIPYLAPVIWLASECVYSWSKMSSAILKPQTIKRVTLWQKLQTKRFFSHEMISKIFINKIIKLLIVNSPSQMEVFIIIRSNSQECMQLWKLTQSDSFIRRETYLHLQKIRRTRWAWNERSQEGKI